MTTKEQLAKWIEAGVAHGRVEEDRKVFIWESDQLRKIFACALGCALVGKYDDLLKALRAYREEIFIRKEIGLKVIATLNIFILSTLFFQWLIENFKR